MTVPRGFPNKGSNLCYANAVLQCLRQCDAHLAPALARVEEGCAVATALRDAIAGDGTGACRVAKLLAERHPSSLQFQEFNDAGEFLLLLTDDMSAESRRLRRVLCGKCETRVTCHQCGKCETRAQECMSLSLCGSSVEDVHSMLRRLFAVTVLPDSWKCDSCGEHRGEQQLTVSRMPRVLVLCVAAVGVAAPLPLSIRFSLKNSQYQLRGAVLRTGNHFVALVCSAPGIWYTCDDNIVQQVPSPHVYADKVYLLLYEQKM